MFCGKCGANNDDNAAFCSSCGAPLNENGAAPNAGPVVTTAQVDTGRRNRIIGMAAVGAGVLAVAVLLVALFGGRGPKATVNKFLNAMFKADAKTIVSLLPDDIVDYIMDEEDLTKKEMIEELEDALAWTIDFYEDYAGKDWKVTHKIVSVDDLSSRKLRDLKEEYEDECGVKVKDAKVVKVELSIDGKELDEPDETEVEVYVIKVGGSWYIDFMSTGGILF